MCARRPLHGGVRTRMVSAFALVAAYCATTVLSVGALAAQPAGRAPIAPSAARSVVIAYGRRLSAAAVADNAAVAEALSMGPAAAALGAEFHLAHAYGGRYLRAFRQPMGAFRGVRVAIPAAAARGPRYFLAIAHGALFANKTPGAMLFEQAAAGAPWRLAYGLPLASGTSLPAVDARPGAPIRGVAVLGPGGRSALPAIVAGTLNESMNAASSEACPGPVPGNEKYFTLTGLFGQLVSSERANCQALHRARVGLSYTWYTTAWPAVSLPTRGGAITLFALTQDATESPPGSDPSLGCPRAPNPCDVFLSPKGRYPELVYVSVYQFAVVTGPERRGSQPVRLVGLSNQVTDVTSGG